MSELPATNALSQDDFLEELYSPRKALLFEATPKATLDDYLLSITKIIHPDSITHAAKILGDRICMFFREEDHIVTLLKDGGVWVKDSFAACRRFHTEPRRVILSNCLPFISNKKLSVALSSLGKVTSSIAELSADTNLESCKHVLSFRKTVEILFDDMDKIPDRVMVEYRTKSVPIYICVEDLLCSTCHAYGHCGASCPQNTETSAKLITGGDEQPDHANKRLSKASQSKRPSSPISSFLCRHAINMTVDSSLTSSIDLSQESLSYMLNPADSTAAGILELMPSFSEDIAGDPDAIIIADDMKSPKGDIGPKESFWPEREARLSWLPSVLANSQR